MGMNDDDVYLLQYMADQEVGHATAIANMLGRTCLDTHVASVCNTCSLFRIANNASRSCEYAFPNQTVKEYLQFSELVTRFGEAGAYGFLEHLNSRDAAQILLQSITIGARQEMIFRQFQGIFPMPVCIPSLWPYPCAESPPRSTGLTRRSPRACSGR